MRCFRSSTRMLLAICTLASGCLAALQPTDVHIKVMERTGDKLFSASPQYPNTFGKVPEITSTTPLSVSFSVKSTTTNEAVAVDQAFVNFRHKETGDETAFVAKRASVGAYRMDLARKHFRAHFVPSPGLYDISLVLGSFADGGVHYALGTVQMSAGKPQQQQTSDTVVFGARPEIHHRFAEPQRMPSAAVSVAFAVLCVVPLVVLFGVWARLGVNVGGLGAEPVASAAFLGLVGAYMALAVAYWVGVKLFPALTYALVLALPTYAAGQVALSRRAAGKPC
ncbi:Oligosaccharyltransferase subunit Ribophorin II-domain-containing protein [Kickxella alabastrina]|uniref:Oligosaccharyltransferase subunit Ribophorin II-domain-containing protein n=1 Tax=Kickxella alabastrina TaxID=61397 RepID=UPI00221EE4D5|nr:Oligosaccharyltransferase subunit Ribophorin II-domain-containing protein [Kickxella alabastrina]KAI7835085.1 Oligosaccharyltransferase subunit Ribophorin II-domain-containing protein [Kickxella alabastrina]KAJ1947068.1 proteasome regulatory particle base subunit [Kickxella alabastrina]